jgi:hypothetical protein
MFRRYSVVMAFCVLGACTSPSRAIGTVFTDRAAFNGAAGGAGKVFDFDPTSGFPLATASINSLDSGRVEVLSSPIINPTFGPGVLHVYPPGTANQVLTGGAASGIPAADELILRFAPGAMPTALGFDIVDLKKPDVEVASVIISDLTRTAPEVFAVSDNDGNASTSVFFGVVWDGPIREARVYAEDPRFDGPFPFLTANGIDNLQVVPEPGLGGLALAGAAALRRRRAVQGFSGPSSSRYLRTS